MEAGRAYRFASLDAPGGGGGDEDSQTLSSQLGDDDPRLTDIEHRVALSPLIAELPSLADTLQVDIQKMLLGQTTPEETQKNITQEFKDILGK